MVSDTEFTATFPEGIGKGNLFVLNSNGEANLGSGLPLDYTGKFLIILLLILFIFNHFCISTRSYQHKLPTTTANWRHYYYLWNQFWSV